MTFHLIQSRWETIKTKLEKLKQTNISLTGCVCCNSARNFIVVSASKEIKTRERKCCLTRSYPESSARLLSSSLSNSGDCEKPRNIYISLREVKLECVIWCVSWKTCVINIRSGLNCFISRDACRRRRMSLQRNKSIYGFSELLAPSTNLRLHLPWKRKSERHSTAEIQTMCRSFRLLGARI